MTNTYKEFETTNLLITKPSMDEQYDLWNIIRQPIVWQYYMHIPGRFNNDRKLFQESLDNWDKQKKFFYNKVENLDSDDHRYTWTIKLKDGTPIGQMTVQPNSKYEGNLNIRNIGWFIDPKYQGHGYATEAATTILDFMFNVVLIDEIRTEANIINPASWKLMEKLGFKRIGESLSSHYDEVGNQLMQYDYLLTKDMYLKNN